MTDLTRIQNVV